MGMRTNGASLRIASPEVTEWAHILPVLILSCQMHLGLSKTFPLNINDLNSLSKEQKHINFQCTAYISVGYLPNTSSPIMVLKGTLGKPTVRHVGGHFFVDAVKSKKNKAIDISVAGLLFTFIYYCLTGIIPLIRTLTNYQFTCCTCPHTY